MQTVQDVLDAIDSFAPARWCLPDDGSGFQIGNRSAKVEKGVVSLDWSLDLADCAAKTGAQMIVTHHPCLYRPTSSIDAATLSGRYLLALAQAGIAHVAAHTNWDAAPGGVSDTMAKMLALQDVVPMSNGAFIESMKIVTFAPESAVDTLLEAMSNAGAGVIGNYDRCAFTSKGAGSFRGLEGSNPFIGEMGKLETTPEVRIEMVLPSAASKSVVDALRAAHPYEEPAYDLYPLTPKVEMPLGRIGALETPLSLLELAVRADEAFGSSGQVWGDPKRVIRTVAVAGGAADESWVEAYDLGADALVTGEVRQHVALEASQFGIGLIASGHYYTEHPGCASLKDRLSEALPEIAWELFVPDPGKLGRPFQKGASLD